jgi:peptidyl-prolyl cis-trans isomerase SurA
MRQKLLIFLLLTGTVFFRPASAQSILDRIIAVIGEEVILESDVDNQYNFLIINGEKDDGTLRCKVVEDLIISKLLLNKARQDSIVVSEVEVEAEVERRMSYILDQMENQNDFEAIYGKSVYEFKEDVKEDIESELLINRLRTQVLAEAEVTPREVKSFFKSIPIDSFGLLPAEVELNHLLIVPPFSEESKKDAKDRLKEIRRQIVSENADFAEMAKRYSEGPSAGAGGNLGEFSRGKMVPAFEEVVYSMRVGEVSPVFETEFGYHIAKLLERRGEILNVSHILIIPDRSENGDSIAMGRLVEIKGLINSDSLTFEQAAILFSEDRATKDCGGCISNPQTGELRISMDMMDAELFFKVDDMEKGEISEPMEYQMPDGTTAFHLLYLKNKIPPHNPNLKDDYNKIYSAALQMKQLELFDKWLQSAKSNIYIYLKPSECNNALKNWIQ